MNRLSDGERVTFRKMDKLLKVLIKFNAVVLLIIRTISF